MTCEHGDKSLCTECWVYEENARNLARGNRMNIMSQYVCRQEKGRSVVGLVGRKVLGVAKLNGNGKNRARHVISSVLQTW